MHFILNHSHPAAKLHVLNVHYLYRLPPPQNRMCLNSDTHYYLCPLPLYSMNGYGFLLG